MLTRILLSISVFVWMSLVTKPLRRIRRFITHPIWYSSPTRILNAVDESYRQAGEPRYTVGEVHEFLRSNAPAQTVKQWHRRAELDRKTARIHLHP